MRDIGSDLRYALRLFARSPGFTAVAVLTLAVGIGASATMFGLLDALLLRELPFPSPDELVVPKLTIASPQKPVTPIPVWSYPKYQTLRETQDVFTEVGAFSDLQVNLSGETTVDRVSGEIVTASYLRVLGVQPALGQPFTDDADDVLWIGHRFWQERLGGDPAVLGRKLRVDGHSLTITGVAPRGFRGLTGVADLWVPVALAPKLLHPQMLTMRWSHWMEVVARARPGLGPNELAARMAAIGATVEAAHPSRSPAQVFGATVTTLRDARKDPKMRTAAGVLFGAVALVLLIGCVNVANLLLSRSPARRHEIAVRAALGATRGRLVRQLITESLVLGLVAGAIGILLALWGLELLSTLRPEALESIDMTSAELRDLDALSLSPRIVAYAISVALAAGVLFGVFPALTATRIDLAGRMREGGHGVAPRLRGRSVLASLELALALVLLVGAGLLLRTVSSLAAVDLGFRPEGVLSFRIDPVRTGERGEGWPRREELERMLAAIPGVEAVGSDVCAPPLGQCDITGVTEIEGRPPFPEGAQPEIDVHFVNAGHLRALGIPLLAGRGLTAADRAGAPKVILINHTAAKVLFPDGDPIGHRLRAAYGQDAMTEIVGVVGDVRTRGATEPPRAAVYVPSLQFGPSSGYQFLRTSLDPLALVGAVRHEVAAFDPDLPIFSVQTLEQRVREATARPRFAALLLGAFAAVALFLASLGVYGVMASLVAQRRREIGIRMALGARPAQVLGEVLRQGGIIAVAGIAVGTGLALAAARVLSGLVYGVAVTDPVTYLAVPALLFVCAAASSLLAGRRAVAIQPVEALRAE